MTLSTTLHRLVSYQREAWFEPSDPRALAVGRILIFGYLWPGFSVPDYAAYAEFRSSAWYPVGFFEALSLPLLDGPTLRSLGLLSTITLLCAALGLAYRLTAPVAALSTLYLQGIPHNFGKVNHAANLLMIAMLVFAFARAADAWSVDAFIARLRKRPAPLPSGAYRWPMRYVALLIAVMYTAAGFSKVYHNGWDWILSDSFRRMLLRHHFTHDIPTQIGVWLASMPLLCHVLAFGAVVVELSGLLALSGRWPFRLVMSALCMLQVSIWLMMGINFQSLLPLFLCLLPWPQWIARLDSLRGGSRAGTP